MITVAILTKNEEKNIIDCIKSVEWCDEIIIVDDYSTDKTIENVQKLNNGKIRIYKHKLDNDFAKQRNYALEKAKSEWVLFIDADERVTVSLQYEILATINGQIESQNGYYLKRKDTMWGKTLRHGELNKIKFLRLAKKNKGLWKGDVHETWDVSGRKGELGNPIIHLPHQDIKTFLEEINFYTTLRSEELFNKRIKTNSLQIIYKPVGKFLYNYIIRLGFLDGIRGLMFAIIMSMHSFLVRAKLWILWQKKER